MGLQEAIPPRSSAARASCGRDGLRTPEPTGPNGRLDRSGIPPRHFRAGPHWRSRHRHGGGGRRGDGEECFAAGFGVALARLAFGGGVQRFAILGALRPPRAAPSGPPPHNSSPVRRTPRTGTTSASKSCLAGAQLRRGSSQTAHALECRPDMERRAKPTKQPVKKIAGRR